jgi:hypothetical protein
MRQFILGLAVVLAAGGMCRAEDAPAAEQPAGEPAAEQAPAEPGKLQLPGIKVDLKKKMVDVDAKVVLREGMLELVACTPDTKEHEAILSLGAKAQHIHLSLLLLGAKPGRPTPWVQLEDNTLKRLLPQGDKVRVSLVFEEDGQEADVPISRFIVNSKGKHTASSEFLFAGSVLTKLEDGRMIYEADQSGNVISLVSFGDEMLVTPDPAMNDYSTLDYFADPQNIPTEGTKVRLRLRLLDKQDKAADDGEEDRPSMHEYADDELED